MSKYAIADEHYFHEGMITHCERPFRSVEQMNETMIKNNNDNVCAKDDVYHIGDFMVETDFEKLTSIVRRLKGRHHLILGNHDNFKPFDYIEAGFLTVHTALWVDEMVLVHDPSVYTFCKNELGILIHGHVHELYQIVPHKPVVNVSVEITDYSPMNFETIRRVVKSNE